MRLLVIVPFLDEQDHLEDMLSSLARQSRRPDSLVLVDDGSTDGSTASAAAFAEQHPYATLLRRPRRPPADRLAGAPEWHAFLWALERTPMAYDVVAKLDADLRLTPDVLGELERRFADDERLGLAGAYLAERAGDGELKRHRCPPGHVEGATKFYRRACFEEISPVPAILGWDTLDEVRARLHGWHTTTFAIASGDPEHLRRMGSYDGLLRGFRRGGAAAWGYGAHPAHVLLSSAVRLAARPPVLCGMHYAAGWAAAALRRDPRAERAARELVRREQRARVRTAIRRRGGWSRGGR